MSKMIGLILIAVALIAGYAILSGRSECIRRIFSGEDCGCNTSQIRPTSTTALDAAIGTQLSTLPALTQL